MKISRSYFRLSDNTLPSRDQFHNTVDRRYPRKWVFVAYAKAYEEFDEAGRMKPSSYYDRIVDVVEELVRFTVLLRPHVDQLTDRYSERVDNDRPVIDAAPILASLAPTKA